MGMVPFHTKFRDLAFRETRTVVVRGYEALPDGDYGFLEFYCDEFGCDCRRVVLQVVTPDGGAKVWASINFGWERPRFYRKWMSGNAKAAAGMAGATLDPLNPQTEHSQALLRLFRDVVLRDSGYVQRLKRHYEIFKGVADPGRVAQRSRGRIARTRKGG